MKYQRHGTWYKATGGYAKGSERIPLVAYIIGAIFFSALVSLSYV
jgi:hypothetical protein